MACEGAPDSPDALDPLSLQRRVPGPVGLYLYLEHPSRDVCTAQLPTSITFLSMSPSLIML